MSNFSFSSVTSSPLCSSTSSGVTSGTVVVSGSDFTSDSASGSALGSASGSASGSALGSASGFAGVAFGVCSCSGVDSSTCLLSFTSLAPPGMWSYKYCTPSSLSTSTS